VWEAETGSKLFIVDGETYSAEEVAFSPDGKLLATANGSSAIIWDAMTGEKLLTLTDANRDSYEVAGVTFSADGRRLATAGGTANVWDAASGKLLLTLHAGKDGINSVAFSPDGRHLAAQGNRI
jgi:WD40 repeat protein